MAIMVSVRFISQTFHVLAALSELLEVTVDVAEWNALSFTDLPGCLLLLQNGTDQLIPLNCIHSVASRNCLWLHQLSTILTIPTLFWRRL